MGSRDSLVGCPLQCGRWGQALFPNPFKDGVGVWGMEIGRIRAPDGYLIALAGAC